MKSFRLLALCASFAVVAAAHAQLGIAGNFNEYVLGNATQSNVDTLGLVAVGGNANFTNFTINSGNDPLYSGYGAVVGGSYTNTYATVNGGVYSGTSFTATGPTINGNVVSDGSVSLSGYGTINGSVKYGTSYTNPNTTVSGGSSHVSTASPINFASNNSYLVNYSSFLAGQSTTTGTSATFSYGTLTLTGAGGSALDIFNITASELSSTNTLIINAPSSATVLVNVSGSSATVSGGMQLQNALDNHVLFNFSGATSLALSNVGFLGTILAPNATTTFSGQLDGGLIVGNLSGSGESHDALFNGDLPPTPAPEPFTLAMPVILGGAWLRKRAKAKQS